MNHPEFKIGNRLIALHEPTYFIADIASNHGGDLRVAKQLIYDAAEAGANAAKFQHFRAETLVSKFAINTKEEKLAHQKSWGKSVFDTYRDVEVPLEWTQSLADTAKECGIDFFTAPYDLEIIDFIDQYVPAYKVGSGDITWIESIQKMASKNKPIIFATGASDLVDVDRVIDSISDFNVSICVMQCNTNYTGNENNTEFLNLNVIKSFSRKYPTLTLGLSDHTGGHLSVLGAISLGARVIEKHFASSVSPDNPDLHFSLNPAQWRKMVDDSLTLQSALGDGIKRVEYNELESQIAQRRALRYRSSFAAGHLIRSEDLIPLRPAPSYSMAPYEKGLAIGKTLLTDVTEQQIVTLADFT